jgi:hypothetical protein
MPAWQEEPGYRRDRPASQRAHGRHNPHRRDPPLLPAGSCVGRYRPGRSRLIRRGPRHVTAPANRDPAPTRSAGRSPAPRPRAATGWPAAHHRHGMARDRNGHRQPGTSTDPGQARGQARSRITWASTLRPSAQAKSPFTWALPDVHLAGGRGEARGPCPAGTTPVSRSRRGLLVYVLLIVVAASTGAAVGAGRSGLVPASHGGGAAGGWTAARARSPQHRILVRAAPPLPATRPRDRPPLPRSTSTCTAVSRRHRCHRERAG